MKRFATALLRWRWGVLLLLVGLTSAALCGVARLRVDPSSDRLLPRQGPAAQVYQRFLARHGVDPAKAAMFEDLARNLETPHALGMTTVLVVPEGQREVFREAWELEGRDAPYVDHLTDDLTRFLEDIVRLF